MGIIKEEIKAFVDETQEFANAKLEAIRMDAIEKTVSFTGGFSSWLIIFAFVMLTLMTLTISLGFYLGNVFENYAIGFGIVGGFYFLILIFAIIYRKAWVQGPIENKIYGKIMSTYYNTDENEQ